MNKVLDILSLMENCISEHLKNLENVKAKYKFKEGKLSEKDAEKYNEEIRCLDVVDKIGFKNNFLELEEQLDSYCQEVRQVQPLLLKLKLESVNATLNYPKEIVVGKFKAKYSNFDNKLPECIPFPIDSTLYIDDIDNNEQLHKLFLRLMYALPRGKCEFTVYDSEEAGGLFGSFNKLNTVKEIIPEQKVITDEDDLKEALKKIYQDVVNMQQSMFFGKSWSVYNENLLKREKNPHIIPYKVIVIYGLKCSMNRECLKYINKLANMGAKSGILVVLASTKEEIEKLRTDKHLEMSCMDTAIKYGSFYGTLIEKVPMKYFTLEEKGEPYPFEDEEWSILDNYIEAVTSNLKAPINFDDTINMTDLFNSEAISCLNFPIGRKEDDGELLNFSTEGTKAHTLIGGQTGSGKSNFLHNMILNACWRYSPEELNLFLLDFKEGVEFNVYAQKKLPHARLVATQADTEYGATVLEYLVTEQNRRYDLFKEYNVNSYAEYRKLPNSKPLPRIMLIVDEFQRLFESNIVERTTPAIQLLGKQGRACGIHMVFATQTLSGIDGFSHISNQFGVRIALKCNSNDLRQILGNSYETTKIDLDIPYAIYNADSGNMDSNSKFAVPEASKKNIEKTIKLLDAMADVKAEMKVFSGQKMPEMPAKEVFTDKGSLKLKLGEKLDYESEMFTIPLKRSSEDNLLVCGNNDAMSQGLLASVVASANGNSMIDEIVYVGSEPLTGGGLDKELKFYANLIDFVADIKDNIGGKKRLVIFDQCNLGREIQYPEGNYGRYKGDAEVMHQYFEAMHGYGNYLVAFYNGYNSLKNSCLPYNQYFKHRICYGISVDDANRLASCTLNSKMDLKNKAWYLATDGSKAVFRPYIED